MSSLSSCLQNIDYIKQEVKEESTDFQAITFEDYKITENSAIKQENVDNFEIIQFSGADYLNSHEDCLELQLESDIKLEVIDDRQEVITKRIKLDNLGKNSNSAENENFGSKFHQQEVESFFKLEEKENFGMLTAELQEKLLKLITHDHSYSNSVIDAEEMDLELIRLEEKTAYLKNARSFTKTFRKSAVLTNEEKMTDNIDENVNKFTTRSNRRRSVPARYSTVTEKDTKSVRVDQSFVKIDQNVRNSAKIPVNQIKSVKFPEVYKIAATNLKNSANSSSKNPENTKKYQYSPKKSQGSAKSSHQSTSNSSDNDSMDEDEDGIQYKEVFSAKSTKIDAKNEIIDFSTSSSVKCPQCPLTFNDKLRYNRHLRLHQAPKFQCSNCFRKFKRKSMLNKHVCDIQCPKCEDVCTCGMETSNDCIICQTINFRYFVDYKQHMKAQHSEIVVCEKCEANNFTFSRHKQLGHVLTRFFKCDECQAELESHEQLVSHQKKHVKIFECGNCDKFFQSRSSLNAHEKAHDKSIKFHCDLCDKDFTRKFCLSHHIKSIHCDKEREKRYLKRNRDMNGERSVGWEKCSKCPLLFRNKHSLQRHFDQVH